MLITKPGRTTNFHSLFQNAFPLLVCILFALIVIVFLIANMGKALNYIFLIVMPLIGVIFYTRNPTFYIGFTWWVWFISPLVRRLADYRGGGFSEQSLILLTPYLVTLVSGMTLIKAANSRCLKDLSPFFLCIFAIGYAYLIGMLNSSFFKSTTILLNWISPIVFASHLLLQWKNYKIYSKVIQKAFFWCLIIAGAYGIYQYLVAPEWDCAWVISVEGGGGGFGEPLPQKLRVWSIMQGPVVFADVMAACLLITLGSSNIMQTLPSIVGYLSLLLTSVRSAWLVWVVGFLTLILKLSSRTRRNLLISAIIILVLMLPLTGMDQFNDLISKRFDTFASLDTDGSAQGRLSIYNTALSFIVTNIVGTGFGGDFNQMAADSGLLNIFVNLGWIGSTAYCSGMFLIVQRLLNLSISINDVFALSSRAVAIGVFSQLPFDSSMIGLPGLLFWSFSALCFASFRYNNSVFSSE
jgi:hypothetical protein